MIYSHPSVFSHQIDVLGLLSNGDVIYGYQLVNAVGARVSLMTYGATLTSFTILDAKQQPVELTLGFDTLTEYLTHPYFFGCTIGRVANRIRAGRFQHDMQQFHLPCNEHPGSHLHGGVKGFDKVVWAASVVETADTIGVQFTHRSPHAGEGYPGNVLVTTTYTLAHDNTLTIAFTATTDRPTPLSLTNHTYWNLAGQGTILDHYLQLPAEYYLETDRAHLPTGVVRAVSGSGRDFRLSRRMGGGHDHYYILTAGQPLSVWDPLSKRALEIHTSQPGAQFYSGDYLRQQVVANRRDVVPWGGFCLETHGYPDAVNHAQFPSVMLFPNEVYSHFTSYAIKNRS